MYITHAHNTYIIWMETMFDFPNTFNDEHRYDKYSLTLYLLPAIDIPYSYVIKRMRLYLHRKWTCAYKRAVHNNEVCLYYMYLNTEHAQLQVAEGTKWIITNHASTFIYGILSDMHLTASVCDSRKMCVYKRICAYNVSTVCTTDIYTHTTNIWMSLTSTFKRCAVEVKCRDWLPPSMEMLQRVQR